MDFDILAEHRMIRDTVREFYEEEIAPIAQDIEDERRFPAEIFGQLAELDVMNVPIDETYGGLGGDQSMYAFVVEGLGRVSGDTDLSCAAHVSPVSKPIELFGTDEWKKRWPTPLATGEHPGGWVLAKSGSGSDASDMDTVAKRDGDGHVIDGTKQFTTNANVIDSIPVGAITDPGASYDGISTFIVDPENDDGLEVMIG